MSVFNIDIQNSNLDNKIVAGLERLSHVYRVLLWDKAKELGISPIQIQVLIFLSHHDSDMATVSYLAREFNLTKPTISDVIKSLEQKKLIRKQPDSSDTRSYTIHLSATGRKIARATENYTIPLSGVLTSVSEADKKVIWNAVSKLILSLNKSGVISAQRTCFDCRHYSNKNNKHFCNLLYQHLQSHEIRIDCKEYETNEAKEISGA